MTNEPLPLAGIRVLELGQLIAGPFAGNLLASFGAEVIKVEAPGKGDPLRSWRAMHAGTSLWWYQMARNKQSITCDLRQPEGQQLIRDLIATGVDVVIENFRPGKMESWGLGWPELQAIAPGVVMVRVSGYGQTGPWKHKPGFANVAEAFGGLRFVTGEPDGPPVRSAISMGDSLAGLYAAFGAMVALRARDADPQRRGQVVDVSLFESVLNMMETLVPEYDVFGIVRQRTGARLDGVVPSNSYRCADGRYIAIGANADTMFRRLMVLIERPDLAADERLTDNQGRMAHIDLIDTAIAAWVRQREHDDALQTLERAEIPSGPIHSAAEVASHPHVLARGTLDTVVLPDGTHMRIPAPVPRLERTPGVTQAIGPTLGEHNEAVYGSMLGLDAKALAGLRQRGII